MKDGQLPKDMRFTIGITVCLVCVGLLVGLFGPKMFGKVKPANEFQKQCLNAKELLIHAQSLTTQSSENQYKDGEIIGTLVTTDINKSKEYLSKNISTLKNIYSYLNQQSNTEAKVAALFLERSIYFYSQIKIDNTDETIKQLSSDKVLLTDWTLNNFFGPIIYSNNNMDLWKKMPSEEKTTIVIESLHTNFQ